MIGYMWTWTFLFDLASMITACWFFHKNMFFSLNPMRKKPPYNALEKSSKRHNWVTFFWLIENFIHFLYPKCGRIVIGSEIGRFGEEDEKCCISATKYNSYVTHLWFIRDPMCNNMWPIWDSSMTYMKLIYDPYEPHLWRICSLSCDSCATRM